MENMATRKCLRIISKPRGIKAATRVYGVGDLTERSSRNAVTLDNAHEEHPSCPYG
ncbi:unnamed protein product [Dovyalis caffra]|uniref:Uncharacterized protein n=1 Tax=Dovyalis caffra TaxID=77055 RepID=A0AAV1SD91_9ROSI|nr:unnamed protein product [Dovyalis caffra]